MIHEEKFSGVCDVHVGAPRVAFNELPSVAGRVHWRMQCDRTISLLLKENGSALICVRRMKGRLCLCSVLGARSGNSRSAKKGDVDGTHRHPCNSIENSGECLDL